MSAGNDAYKVTWLVRRLFRAMAEQADAYLRDSGLTAADQKPFLEQSIRGYLHMLA